MEKKSVMKIVTITCIIIAVIAIVLIVLYFATDIFIPKSNLFAKFFSQNLEHIEQISDFSFETSCLNEIKQNNYKESTKISTLFMNSKNTQEDFNIFIEGDVDNVKSKSNKKINIKYGNNTNVLNVEYFKENDMYGLLFSDVVTKYISIRNDNLKEVLKNLNIDTSNFSNDKIQDINLLQIINFSKEEKEQLKNRYLQIALREINSNQYTSENDRMITLSNGQSVTTKSYVLTLSSEQTKNIFTSIFKQMYQDEVILNKLESLDTDLKNIGVNIGAKQKFLGRLDNLIQYISDVEENFDSKIILYVLNGQTVRTSFEIGNYNVILDFDQATNSLNIRYKNVSLEEDIELNITKSDIESGLKREIKYNDKILSTEMQKQGNVVNFKVNVIINNEKNIQVNFDTQIELSQDINVEKKFEDLQTLVINDYEQGKLNSALIGLKTRVINHLREVQKGVESDLLGAIIQYSDAIDTDLQIAKETEIKRFNNQFELYKSDKAAEIDIIYNLLDLAGKNMISYQKIGTNKIKIYIRQDEENSKLAKELKKEIKESEKDYTISFEYDSDKKINLVILEEYIEEEEE